MNDFGPYSSMNELIAHGTDRELQDWFTRVYGVTDSEFLDFIPKWMRTHFVKSSEVQHSL